jgi:hypothetical protein
MLNQASLTVFGFDVMTLIVPRPRSLVPQTIRLRHSERYLARGLSPGHVCFAATYSSNTTSHS